MSKYYRTRWERRRYRDTIQQHDQARFPSLNIVMRMYRDYEGRHGYDKARTKKEVRRWMKERASWY